MTNTTTLTGSPKAVPIALGYTLKAPGLSGSAMQVVPSTTRSAQRIDAFTAALGNAKASVAAHFDFDIVPTAPAIAPGVTASRGARTIQAPLPPTPPLEFAAPKPAAHTKSIVLHTDENGEMSWIWPSKTDTKKTYFVLPPARPQPPAAGKSQERGAIIAIMRRVVKVITWATDEVVGDLAMRFAQDWEQKHRPYGFHYVQPGKFGGDVPWGQLAGGRSLLLLHGTFSTGDGAFSGLISSDWLKKMANYYGGRIFAFNHPSLYHSPQENIQQFRKMLPPEVKHLDLDVITHSRGGLVGRELTERFGAPDGKDKRIEVKRAVLVAGPNSGTILTDRQHWSNLIDAYTNLLVGMPDNAFTITLEGILTLIKIVGGGVVHGLPGLQSMLPGGDYIKALNQKPKPAGKYYALAAQYLPKEERPLAQMEKMLLVKVLRAIFGEDSDMVVPTQGCYCLNPQVAGFTIPQERYKVYGPGENIHHVNFFEKDQVNRQLHDWLTS